NAQLVRQAGTSMSNRPFSSSSILIKPNEYYVDANFGWNLSPIGTYCLRFYIGVVGDTSTSNSSLVGGSLDGNTVWTITRGIFGRLYLNVNGVTQGVTGYNSLVLNVWYRIDIKCV